MKAKSKHVFWWTFECRFLHLLRIWGNLVCCLLYFQIAKRPIWIIFFMHKLYYVSLICKHHFQLSFSMFKTMFVSILFVYACVHTFSEHSPFPSLPSKCLTPRTWWLPAIPATADTLQSPLSSVAVCPWRRLTSKCWTSRTRTAHTLSNGSPTTWRPLCVTSHPGDWRWPPPSLVTALPSKSCSRGSLNSSLPCSGGKLSCIGTQVRTHLWFFITTFFSYKFN